PPRPPVCPGPQAARPAGSGAPADPPAGPGAPADPPAGPGAPADPRADAVTQLAEYFSGRRRSFDLPLDWSRMSRLRRRVLGVLFDSVGYGETVSYGELARWVQSAGGPLIPARGPGPIMGADPDPAHRPLPPGCGGGRARRVQRRNRPRGQALAADVRGGVAADPRLGAL